MDKTPAVGALERFLFSHVPATPLALLRIATGFLMVLWSVTLLNDYEPLLTWLRAAPHGDIGWWQFWPAASAEMVGMMVWLLLGSSVLLTLGLWTRLVSWTVFILALVLQRYNPGAFNGGDLILRGVLLLGLALGPSGAYLSLDSVRRLGFLDWRAPLISVWPLRFIQLHISFGYVLTVLLKLQGQNWVDGTAMWYALNLGDLIRFHLPEWLIAPPVGAVLTWGALFLELGVGLGVWFRRFRPWALLGGVFLHVGIALTLEIGFFSYVLIVSYLAFVSWVSDVRNLLRRRRPPGKRVLAVTPSVVPS